MMFCGQTCPPRRCRSRSTFRLVGDSMSTAAPFARFVNDYPSLVETLRERTEQMQIARLELDRLVGLPDGYSGKLLSKSPRKNIGIATLGPLLESLGLVIC